MQTSALSDDQPLDPTPPQELEFDSSWCLDKLGAFASGEISRAFFAKEAAILHATKSAVHLRRAVHALSLARDNFKGEVHGDWAKFKRNHWFANNTVNDAIRLYERAETEDAVVGQGITEAKKKFVYPPKEATTGTSNPVQHPGKKVAKFSFPKPASAVTQETNPPSSSIHHAQGSGTVTPPHPTNTDSAASGVIESDPTAAPEEPEVSFTTAPHDGDVDGGREPVLDEPLRSPLGVRLHLEQGTASVLLPAPGQAEQGSRSGEDVAEPSAGRVTAHEQTEEGTWGSRSTLSTPRSPGGGSGMLKRRWPRILPKTSEGWHDSP